MRCLCRWHVLCNLPCNDRLLAFPRLTVALLVLCPQSNPQMIYCNAEGIVWVDNYRIAIASDKAKARQPYW